MTLCAMLMHNKLEVRKSWDGHTINGFDIAISSEHYRCFKIWVKEKQSIRLLNAVLYKHQYITMPEITKADSTVVAAQQLMMVLQNEILINIGERSKTQLEQLASTCMEEAKATTEKCAAAKLTTSQEDRKPPRVGGEPMLQMRVVIQVDTASSRVNKEPKWIVELTTEAGTQEPNPITQDEGDTEPQKTGLVENARAKRRTWTLTKECILAAIEN